MIDFNAPIMEPEEDTTVAGTAAAPAGIIDLNDPRLSSESLEGSFDEQKDAYELPPPPPDGIYIARLRLKQVKDSNGNLVDFKAGGTKDGSQVYLQTALEAELVDNSGRQDGKKITDYFVSTMINRDKAMAVATILLHAKVPAPKTKTHKAWMDTLIKWLASEPTLKIQTAWEASWENGEKEAERLGQKKPRPLTGMHNFPVVNGNPNPEAKWPDGSVTRARARIIRYHSL